MLENMKHDKRKSKKANSCKNMFLHNTNQFNQTVTQKLIMPDTITWWMLHTYFTSIHACIPWLQNQCQYNMYNMIKPEDQWSCKRSPETRDMYQPATKIKD